MENATKALLISAGVLFSVVIFAAMFFVYNMISDYYKNKESSISTEKLAALNNEFSVYQRDLTGFELVGLINKAIDFNKKYYYGMSGTVAEQNDKKTTGYPQMSITVEINNLPNKKLFSGYIGREVKFTGNGDSNTMFNDIKSMQALENSISAGDLSILASHATELNSLTAEKFKERVAELVGNRYKNNTKDITKENILKYEDYLAFKRGEFECKSMKTNSIGLVESFKFVQK